MTRGRATRVSDGDRERALERLRIHAVAGRLSVDELGERAELVLRARTNGELRRVFADLPRRAEELRGVGAALPMKAHLAVFAFATTVLIASWEIAREPMGPMDNVAGYFWPFWIIAAWALALAVRGFRRRGRPRQLRGGF